MTAKVKVVKAKVVKAKGAAAKGAPTRAAAKAPQAPAARRARSLARRLALQALYQLQINEHPWQDVHQQFAQSSEAERVDREYFRELLMAIAPHREDFDERLAGVSEITPAQLDPIEHAALWLGWHELESRPEVPYRVVLSEAVTLAKDFGATDGHKYVNAVLDRAARLLRAVEYGR